MFQANEIVECTLVEENFRLCATIRHTDGQRLLIEVDAHDASHVVPGQAIHLVQSYPDGLYMIDTQVINRRDNLFVAAVRTPQLMQRRRSHRAACDIPAQYGRDMMLSDMTNLDPAMVQAGRVKDLSLGGMRLLTSELLCAQVLLGISFPLTDNEDQVGIVNVEGSVIRCSLLEQPEITDQGKMEFVVAVRFTRLVRIDQIRLQKFLFLNQ